MKGFPSLPEILPFILINYIIQLDFLFKLLFLVSKIINRILINFN